MLFDAGDWGMVEVDEVRTLADKTVGIANPHDIYNRVTYINRGKKGCSRARCVAPADLSPEARAERKRRIIQVASEILARQN